MSVGNANAEAVGRGSRIGRRLREGGVPGLWGSQNRLFAATRLTWEKMWRGSGGGVAEGGSRWNEGGDAVTVSNQSPV